MVNLSCWGRCEEPCGEGAARVRPWLGLDPPRGPAGRERPRSCSAPPPAPLPGPVFTAPGAAPTRASCPPPLPGEAEGVGAPGAAPTPATSKQWGCVLRPALDGGQGAPSTAPPKRREGVHIRGGWIRTLGSPLPKLGGSESSQQSPLGGGVSRRPKSSGGTHPRFPAPFLGDALFWEGCASDRPPPTGPQRILALEVPGGAPGAPQARGQGRPRPCLSRRVGGGAKPGAGAGGLGARKLGWIGNWGGVRGPAAGGGSRRAWSWRGKTGPGSWGGAGPEAPGLGVGGAGPGAGGGERRAGSRGGGACRTGPAYRMPALWKHHVSRGGGRGLRPGCAPRLGLLGAPGGRAFVPAPIGSSRGRRRLPRPASPASCAPSPRARPRRAPGPASCAPGAPPRPSPPPASPLPGPTAIV